MIKLYDYFRSSASYRVRIALNLKNLPFERVSIHLIEDGGQQHHPDYAALNPQHLVPTLIDNNVTLTQSLAIIDYLETTYPKTSLYPNDPIKKAYAQQIAQIIAMDIHPLNNLRVLNYLTQTFNIKDTERQTWYQHWVMEGFQAIEALVTQYQSNGLYCIGGQPTIADVCLIPQVYNAIRFQCPLEYYPTIQSIYQHCVTLDPFQKAAPEA